MRLRSIAVLVAAFAAAGCSSVARAPGEGGGTDSLAHAGTGKALLDQAVTLIAAGSPSSLAEGIRLAAAADSMGAAGAVGAGVVGEALRRGLYPHLSSAEVTGPSWNEARIESPFLARIAPALILLDHHPALTDSQAAELGAKLTEAGTLLPSSPLPPFFQGLLVQRRSGTPADERAQFEAALKRSPDFAPAAAELSETIIRSGSAPFELPLLQHLASLLTTESERYAALARAALAAGQPGLAADAAARGLLHAPDDPEFALLRAQSLEATGDWYQSLRVLDALLRVNPDLSEATVLKARILHEKAANDAEALGILADAESRYPSDASFPGLRARILLDEGRTMEGVAALRRAHELEPQSIDVLSALVATSVQAQQWNEAASWLALIPMPARRAEHFRLGWQISTGLEDHERALEYARQLLAVTPSVDALAMEARAMIAMGQLPRAMVVIDHALLAMDPPPRLASELHTLRARSGSADPLLDLHSALRENPDNVEALVAIVNVLAGQKDYRKAMEYAKRAAALSPGNASLAQEAADLEKLAASAQNQ